MSKTLVVEVTLTVPDDADPYRVADEVLDVLCMNDTNIYESCDGTDPIGEPE